MRRVVPWLLAGLGGTLVVAGVAVALGSAADPTVVYGGGYAPLAPESRGPYQSELTLTFDDAARWTDGQVVGGGLAILGLLVLVGLGGWLLGRRGAGPRLLPEPPG